MVQFRLRSATPGESQTVVCCSLPQDQPIFERHNLLSDKRLPRCCIPGLPQLPGLATSQR